MIKWNSNFQIPDSTAQMAVCLVEIENFTNKGGNCIVDLNYWDDLKTWVFKKDQIVLNSNYTNTFDIYNEILVQFPDSEVIE